MTPSARPARTRLVGCAAFFGAMIVLAIVVAAGFWIYQTRQVNARLATQIARVRARGEPLTTFELDDYYQPAPNRPDMTNEIMAALAICVAPDLKPLAANLPIVGLGPKPPLPPDEWSQLEEAEDYLRRHAAALETFRDVALRDGTTRFPVDFFTVGVAPSSNHSQAFRSAARVLSLQFHVHLHHRRVSEAVDCVIDQLALARALDREPILISQYVRIAIVNVGASHIQDALQCADVSDADLVRLQHVLRKLECESCLIHAIAGEKTVAYTACLDPRLATTGAHLTQAEAKRLASRPPERAADAAKIIELNLRICESAEKSLFDAIQESLRVKEEMHQLAGGFLNKFSYMMTILASPIYEPVIIGFARLAARRDYTDAALAADLFRRRYGHWPETLTQLVPDYLPAVPVDPFSNQPLKLLSTPDQLKVYSVSRNGKDDNGNLVDVDDLNSDIGIVIPFRHADKP